MVDELLEGTGVSLGLSDDLDGCLAVCVWQCLLQAGQGHTEPSDAFSTLPVTPRELACFTVKDLEGN